MSKEGAGAAQESPVGSEEILKALMRLRVRILAYMRIILRDFDLSEDAYQELALSFSNRDKTFNVKLGGVERWLFGAARKQALKTLRDRRRKRTVLLDEETLCSMEVAFTEERPETTSAQKAALERCLRRLSNTNRELIQLRYTEEMDVKSIAERLRRKVGSIYVMLGRVHLFLRRCVKKKPVNDEVET